MIDEERHVIPADDDKKHIVRAPTDYECWCEPDFATHDGVALWLHHAHSLLCVPANQLSLRTWRRGTKPRDIGPHT